MTYSKGPYNIIRDMIIWTIYIKCSYSVLLRMRFIAISPKFIDTIKKYPKIFKILGPLKNPSSTFIII